MAITLKPRPMSVREVVLRMAVHAPHGLVLALGVFKPI